MAPPKLRSPFSGAALPTTAGVEPPERGRWTGKRGSHRAHTLPLPHACPLPHGRPTSHVNRQASPERSHTSVPCKRAEILRKTRVEGRRAEGAGRAGGNAFGPLPLSRWRVTRPAGTGTRGSFTAFLKTCGLTKTLVYFLRPKPVSQREASCCHRFGFF